MGKDLLKNNTSRIGKIARRGLASQKISNKERDPCCFLNLNIIQAVFPGMKSVKLIFRIKKGSRTLSSSMLLTKHGQFTGKC
jgi:hypothetical protein